MRRISVFLLGPPRVVLEKQEVTVSRTKVLALLMYLAATGQVQSREVLAELLFPESTRDRTKSNFRRTLSTLNAKLGKGVLSIGRRTVEFARDVDVWTDVAEFKENVDRVRHAVGPAPRGEPGETALSGQPGTSGRSDRLRAHLARALKLYRGDFAAGFYLKHSVAFDAWQLEMQEQLSSDMLFALRCYVSLLEKEGLVDEAVRHARRILLIDPYDESTHRGLMRLYGSTDRLSAAAQQFRECGSALAELGAEPEETTKKLMEELRSGRFHNTPTAVPADSPENAPPPRLPTRPTSFVGRQTELQAISERLANPSIRMVSLTGPAGIGKTRLAVEAARAATDDFPDGTYFFDLTLIQEPTRLPSAIAAGLQVHKENGRSPSLSSGLAAHIANKRLLLVLDNFEHIMKATGLVAELLRRTFAPTLLVTSRERLRLAEEEELVVPPLASPISGRPAGRLDQYEAIRLFIDRARAAHPAFRPENESLSAIAEICARLDGLPLAIELAASRLSVFSTHELLQRIENPIGLLKHSTRNTPARQHTLQSELDWSYRLLNRFEQQVFVRLSVFANGCTLQAAQRVCAVGEALGESDVVDGIQALIDKSLLQRETVSGESRYRMLATIHDYGSVKLRESDNVDSIRRTHADYYLGLAEGIAERLHGPHQKQWCDRIEAELSNMDRAIAWLYSIGEVATCLRFGVALEWAWYRLGRVGTGAYWLEKILSATEDSRQFALVGSATRALGWMYFVQGDWARARSLYSRSVQLCRSRGDREGMGMALSYLGVVERWLGEEDLGTRHAEEAVTIARESSDTCALRVALIWAYATTGGKRISDRQRTGLEEAMRLARETGDEWSLAHALSGIGDVLRAAGKPEAAGRIYEQALAGFDKLQDRWLTAWTLEGLGRARYATEDYDRAERCVLKSMDLFLMVGDRENALELLSVLIKILDAGGEDRAAACLAGVMEGPGPTAAEHAIHEARAKYRTEYADEWYRGASMSLEEVTRELLARHSKKDGRSSSGCGGLPPFHG